MMMLKTFVVFFLFSFLSFYSVLATRSNGGVTALFHSSSSSSSSVFGKSVPIASSSTTTSQTKRNSFASFGRKRNNNKKHDDNDTKSFTSSRIPIDMEIQARAHSSSTLNPKTKNKYVVDTVVSTIWS